MPWDFPGTGKQSKGKGPATKNARRRRRERAEAQEELERQQARRRMANVRHDGFRREREDTSTLASVPVDKWQPQVKPNSRGRR